MCIVACEGTATAGEGRLVQAWSVPQRKLLGSITIPIGPVYALVFAPSGRMFAAACAGGVVLLFTVPEAVGISAPASTAAAAAAAAVASASNSQIDASVFGQDGISFAAEIKLIRDHNADVRSVSFSAQGHMFLTAGDDRAIRLYSLVHPSNGAFRHEFVRQFDGHAGPVTGLSFAPDAVSFLSVSKDKIARLWHLEVCGCEFVLVLRL